MRLWCRWNLLTGRVGGGGIDLLDLGVEYVYECRDTFAAFCLLDVMCLCECGDCAYLKSMQSISNDESFVVNEFQ